MEQVLIMFVKAGFLVAFATLCIAPHANAQQRQPDAPLNRESSARAVERPERRRLPRRDRDEHHLVEVVTKVPSGRFDVERQARRVPPVT